MFVFGSVATIGCLLETTTAKPSLGAEEIRLYLNSPLAIAISVESLENFAATGEITGDLGLIARFLDESTLNNLRQGLQRRFPLDLIQTHHLAYSPLGRDAIEQVGKVIKFTPNQNGFYGLRAAVIGAAANAESEGWTILDALKQFPTDAIEIEVGDLLNLQRELTLYFDYNRAAVKAIKEQAKIEAKSSPKPGKLSDLSQPGAYAFNRETLTVNNPALRQTQRGLSVNYDFPVDAYLPQGLSQPAPIVIISHGFGAVKENFVSLAEHLASYGFVVLVPDHVGSDLSYRKTYLQGQLNTLLSPIEFLNRPQEISFLIDELEKLVASKDRWAKLLDLERIGVMGHSLGGSTALSLAGAELDRARLVETCQQDNLILNFSLYLQCRGQFLPPENFDLKEPRIKAAIAAHPLASGIFGPEGMSKIDIPLMITAGSQDVIAPVVTEQIHPFVWMRSQPKYLALFDPGTHFATGEQSAAGADTIPEFLIGKYRNFGREYFKSLNVAFFEAYLRDRPEFLPYLSAAYGRAISANKPMKLFAVKSLTPTQLETAYGKTPPISIVPPAVETEVTSVKEESILSEIKRTGVLKVAMRRDAAPLGYIDARQRWSGYCGDLAIALAEHLTEKLDLDLEVELAELPSNLDNRFSLVRDNTVHLECGPNTIREDIEGVTFSNPFLATGTRLLTKSNNQLESNLDRALEKLRVGVLKNTTTAQFLQDNYPQANIVYFEGANGQSEAIEAVRNGALDTFANDSVLSLAAIEKQNTFKNYVLQPTRPLTCDFYGLILPADDPEWRGTVDRFLTQERAERVLQTWFERIFPSELNDLEYCLNR
ncbi:alpha/beta fold hydrolase [Myxosarcina sp. GI1]|uniref:alpha/beta fold hydrolase n=1 Tax=Myxosarcina sp. GI1 TaxID=1541065 RepID=UPI00209E9215|nr:alpha/beta fold hydrolase [Myxosarcina sp. GI1]